MWARCVVQCTPQCVQGREDLPAHQMLVRWLAARLCIAVVQSAGQFQVADSLNCNADKSFSCSCCHYQLAFEMELTPVACKLYTSNLAATSQTASHSATASAAHSLAPNANGSQSICTRNLSWLIVYYHAGKSALAFDSDLASQVCLRHQTKTCGDLWCLHDKLLCVVCVTFAYTQSCQRTAYA